MYHEATTVSYTHLDVYKRQEQDTDILLSMDSYTADISSWLCHLTHIQPQNRSPLRSAVRKLQGL